MTLMTYGAEQRAAGKYTRNVELIRKWYGRTNKSPMESAAEDMDVTLPQFREVITLIEKHPDWDDEKVADQTDWRKQ